MTNYEAYFWDFDGVIIESNIIREKGFRMVLRTYSDDVIELFLDFHRKNGGLSRYVKFRHLFENILCQTYTSDMIMSLSREFSVVMRKLLVNKDLLIDQTLKFIKSNFQKNPMFIVSGSDQNELQFLCQALGISGYFKEILGSPSSKEELVGNLVANYKLLPADCVLIGDSINDFDAAKKYGLNFLGFNNAEIEALSTVENFIR